jgi:hypothetical protein
MRFDWACSRDDGLPCFSAAGGRGSISGPAWTLPGGTLAAEVSHAFTVVISKGARAGVGTGTSRSAFQGGLLATRPITKLWEAPTPPACFCFAPTLPTAALFRARPPGEGAALRTATATLPGVRPRRAPVPTGVIARSCGSKACPPKQDAGSPLSLVLQLPAAFAAAAVSWSRADGEPLPADAASPSGLQLNLPASQLPSGGASTVTLVANLTLAGATGQVAVTVPINAAPFCPIGGPPCLSVVTKRDAFPDAEFVAAAAGFADDDDGASALVYEWGTLGAGGARSPLLIDTVTSFRFTGLLKARRGCGRCAGGGGTAAVQGRGGRAILAGACAARGAVSETSPRPDSSCAPPYLAAGRHDAVRQGGRFPGRGRHRHGGGHRRRPPSRWAAPAHRGFGRASSVLSAAVSSSPCGVGSCIVGRRPGCCQTPNGLAPKNAPSCLACAPPQRL